MNSALQLNSTFQASGFMAQKAEHQPQTQKLKPNSHWLGPMDCLQRTEPLCCRLFCFHETAGTSTVQLEFDETISYNFHNCTWVASQLKMN